MDLYPWLLLGLFSWGFLGFLLGYAFGQRVIRLWRWLWRETEWDVLTQPGRVELIRPTNADRAWYVTWWETWAIAELAGQADGMGSAEYRRVTELARRDRVPAAHPEMLAYIRQHTSPPELPPYGPTAGPARANEKTRPGKDGDA